MKEPAGEANLTVVAIILIGVIVAVATPLITSMMETTKKRSCCTEAGGVFKGSSCTGGFDQSTYDACINAGND